MQTRPHLSRRQFTKTTASLLTTVTATRMVQAKTPLEDHWIDAHVHIWTADTASYPLSTGFSTADMQPASFTPEQLFAECRPEGVSRIVLIQMNFYGFDHRYMLNAMRTHPGIFSGVALIDFRSEDVVQRMRDLAQQGVRGFRLHSLGDAQEWGKLESMAKLWQAAGQSGLAICPLINPEDMPHVAALATKHPDTRVVVDHFARVGMQGGIQASQLDRLCDLAKLPNIYLKTSAFYALGDKQPPYDDLQPMIRRVVDAFGPRRLMWASDCPFQVEGQHSYAASIAQIRDRINFLSEDEKSWLLRKTAEQVFFAA